MRVGYARKIPWTFSLDSPALAPPLYTHFPTYGTLSGGKVTDSENQFLLKIRVCHLAIAGSGALGFTPENRKLCLKLNELFQLYGKLRTPWCKLCYVQIYKYLDKIGIMVVLWWYYSWLD